MAKVGTNREYFSLRVLGVLDGFIKGESSSTPRFSSHREIFPRIFFHELLSSLSLSVFATILRLFRVVITTKYFRKSTLPFPRIISLRKALCVYTYIYTRLYLYIDGERGCVRVHKRKSSRAISAITSASAQTLPFFRRHWRSSLCRSLVSSSVSDIFFPPFFLLLLLSSFFFLYHPHFYSSFQQRRSNCAARRQFSLRLIR